MFIIGCSQKGTVLTIFGRGLKLRRTQRKEQDEDEQTLDTVMNYCIAEKSKALECFKLHQMKQKEGQSFGEFETELRNQLRNCEFDCGKCKTSYGDRMLADQIIAGVRDKELQLRMLRSTRPTLEKIQVFGRSHETARNNIWTFQSSSTVNMLNNKVEESAVEVAAIQRRNCYVCKGNLTIIIKVYAQIEMLSAEGVKSVAIL